jgi:hypothetical protein
MTKMIELGQTVTDTITGFKGVVTGRCEYITGCNQVLLVPKVAEDGAYKEGHWFDEQRVEVDPAAAIVTLDNGATPGFDKEAPKR